MYDPKPLFSERDLHDVLTETRTKMLQEIETYPADKLLNTNVDDLAEFFATKFEIAPVNLLEKQISVDHRETKVDKSQNPLRYLPVLHGEIKIPATQITLFIPFEGDPNIFKYRTSTCSLSPPRGCINGNILELSILCIEHDNEFVSAESNRLIKRVKDQLECSTKDLTKFNSTLRTLARQCIETRRQKLLKNCELAASLGFPLRKRSNVLTTYVMPELRKKVTPKPPPAITGAFVPEPTIEMAEYENILSIIQKTATMLERSPQAFRGMTEENLRYQFLVPLNSHYEGQITGETFNFSGKTDILIRHGDRSVFIAECKIWRGSKSLRDAIDQLLTYATWRDTKTAIILFNRNRKLTDVLGQIPDILVSHHNFKRMLNFQNQTGFRCMLAHKNDPDREIFLTVLVFDVPER